MPEVIVIPPNEERKKRLRVAAYCRVSTEKDLQAVSLQSQVRHYESEIRSNPHHDPIITKSIFNRVQHEKESRSNVSTVKNKTVRKKIDIQMICCPVECFAVNVVLTIDEGRGGADYAVVGSTHRLGTHLCPLLPQRDKEDNKTRTGFIHCPVYRYGDCIVLAEFPNLSG